MFTQETTILIVDDNSAFVLSILRSFSGYRNVNLDVLVSSSRKPYSFRKSRYIRKIYHKQLTDENFEKTVKDAAVSSSANFIIPTREWISKLLYKYRTSIETMAKIHPVSDVQTIETVNDKWNLNKWLEDNHFPYARVMKFSNGTPIANANDLFTFPVLLKPSLSQGGIGIKQIDSVETLKSTLLESEALRNGYFLQEYINGYDIGINVFSIKGKILCHTIQKGLFTGNFSFSRGTQYVRDQELFDLTSDIVGKLNYTGVANLDFRFDARKETYILIDFNARYWSTLDGSRFMGVNFPVLVTAYSLGIPCSFPEYATGTYYCANAAIKTLVRNLYASKKYPIKLRHTKLVIILKDPVPEIVNAAESLIEYLKKKFK